MSCITSIDEITKEASEILNVSMDFSEVLGSSETITSQAIVISPSDVSISAISSGNGLVVFTIAGGTNGTNYIVKVTVQTSASQTIVGEGSLRLRGR